jgi:hypothetical protein
MSPIEESQYGATTEAAESLIAQLYSQNKLATLRRKNRKIQYKTVILKANEHAQYAYRNGRSIE